MNRNQSRGAGRQVRGAIKDGVGKLTRDRGLQADGKLDKGLGKVQKKLGDAKASRTRTRGVPPSADDI